MKDIDRPVAAARLRAAITELESVQREARDRLEKLRAQLAVVLAEYEVGDIVRWSKDERLYSISGFRMEGDTLVYIAKLVRHPKYYYLGTRDIPLRLHGGIYKLTRHNKEES